MSELQIDFIELEVERETTQWYRQFTEIWTVSIAVDAENPNGDVRYAVRAIGPNGEAASEGGLEPEDTPSEVRAKFEDILRDATPIV